MSHRQFEVNLDSTERLKNQENEGNSFRMQWVSNGKTTVRTNQSQWFCSVTLKRRHKIFVSFLILTNFSSTSWSLLLLLPEPRKKSKINTSFFPKDLLIFAQTRRLSPTKLNSHTFWNEGRKRQERMERLFQLQSQLAYGNTDVQAVMDHWCPAVPPLQPQRINYSTWSELTPWYKQQHGQHYFSFLN